MTAQVVKLTPKTTERNRTTTRSRRMSRAIKRQAFTAVGIGTVATSLVALSLSHLAHGIEAVTAAPGWEAWAMAVGIDCGFVGIELSQIMAVTAAVKRSIDKYAKPAVAGTLAGSAAMNAFAFGAAASNDYALAAGVSLGVAIPALIYAMTRIGAALYLDCQTRTA